MIGRSLKTRLVAGMVVTQVLAIMVAMLIFPLLSPFVTFNDIADTTLRSRVEHAIVKRGDGMLVVGNSPALRTYLAARPFARFAAIVPETGQVVIGSDPELADRLRRLNPSYPNLYGNLTTPWRDGSKLIITTDEGAHGRLVFATSGNAFRWEDWPSMTETFLPVLLPAYGPVILGALVLLPMIVWIVTRPLQKLSDEASRISPGTLDLRLDESGLGSELQGLVKAINAALARLEDGVRRQRLYAANAAHELRTPVAILGLHIEEFPDGREKAQARADLARIATLVDQLVTVARLGQNHVQMDEQIDLVGLVSNVISDRAPIAIHNGREIALASDVTEFAISGNRQALFSALANVIENALRAEPEGGTVLVALAANGVLDIVDHGEGLSPGDRELVFEPFWRKSESTPGAGLGLAIVKEIAERHSITMKILETPGGGATFRFLFNRAIDPT